MPSSSQPTTPTKSRYLTDPGPDAVDRLGTVGVAHSSQRRPVASVPSPHPRIPNTHWLRLEGAFIRSRRQFLWHPVPPMPNIVGELAEIDGALRPVAHIFSLITAQDRNILPSPATSDSSLERDMRTPHYPPMLLMEGDPIAAPQVGSTQRPVRRRQFGVSGNIPLPSTNSSPLVQLLELNSSSSSPGSRRGYSSPAFQTAEHGASNPNGVGVTRFCNDIPLTDTSPNQSRLFLEPRHRRGSNLRNPSFPPSGPTLDLSYVSFALENANLDGNAEEDADLAAAMAQSRRDRDSYSAEDRNGDPGPSSRAHRDRF
ncbi:hypothetical protein BXZ70DRAFT_1013026 [Cristinia sonorae]|uniref:Uncharacterized protein n=1 Tax=Cristinia sonorae TaxID=1940300 RepID=A0A8K0UCV3_9AGAR|nr:hypothetical protein BXZ70DRAFT_1013026 [Cristinia sonorae]